jgi:peroxiredoxin
VAVQVGQKAPDFTLKDTAGRSYTLSALRGQVVLLEFWATWCPPCQAAVPELNQVHQMFKDKGFTLLAISVDEGPGMPSRLKEFNREHKVQYPVLYDSQGVDDLYGVMSIPMYFLIDRQGVVASRHLGYVPGMAQSIAQEIEALLKR